MNEFGNKLVIKEFTGFLVMGKVCFFLAKNIGFIGMTPVLIFTVLSWQVGLVGRVCAESVCHFPDGLIMV